MKYFLGNNLTLKWLEEKYLYDIKKDELYEVDDEAFDFLKSCILEGCSEENVPEEFIDFCKENMILVDTPYLREVPPITKSPTPSLRYLELQITDKCNLRCKHCYLDRSENNELSVKSIKNILDEFTEMQGLRVMITGGEPLVHNNFKQINEILSLYPIRKILFTNGLLLSRELLTHLNFDEIQFSIDGLQKGHEALRGKGTFTSVINKLKEAKKLSIDVSVATMVHSENVDEFEEMEQFFKELGVKDWTVDIPTPVGNLANNTSFCLPPHIAGKYLNYGFGENYHASKPGYACGLHLLSILANGSVAKCAFYKHSTVGYITEGLKNIWSKMEPIKLENLECKELSCPEINNCRGGCRYRATFFSENNADNSKKDIYKCFAYGIIKNI
ncbi:MAG: radical SAM protein [Thermodesulfovibrionales bacterium]|nr:radical SAM protein [Thermodesulfovibrionales bacterium]